MQTKILEYIQGEYKFLHLFFLTFFSAKLIVGVPGTLYLF